MSLSNEQMAEIDAKYNAEKKAAQDALEAKMSEASGRVMPQVEAYLAGKGGDLEAIQKGLDNLHRLGGRPAKHCRYVDLSNKVYYQSLKYARKGGK